MVCELCNKHPASVHVTDITRTAGQTSVSQKHICDECSRVLELPSSPLMSKGVLDIWKLLRQSAQKARAEGSLICPECGMSLAEFRSKGRLGCPKDYEVFRSHLEPLLLRVHNAKEHRGRTPGLDQVSTRRTQQLSDLRAKLEEAIRDEAYESAARLRDKIQELEASHGSP